MSTAEGASRNDHVHGDESPDSPTVPRSAQEVIGEREFWFDAADEMYQPDGFMLEWARQTARMMRNADSARRELQAIFDAAPHQYRTIGLEATLTAITRLQDLAISVAEEE